MREIVIIRHAAAFERDAKRWPDDRLRPLTRQGRQKFRAAAAGLARYIPEVDLLLTSPLRRATETAAILMEVAGWPRATERRELEPGNDPTLTLASLTRPRCDRVALVSHEPLVSALLALCIAGPESSAQLEVRKGAVALIRFPGGIRAGSATLLALLPPRALRRMG
jgi:phosphohistidine phosphatase